MNRFSQAAHKAAAMSVSPEGLPNVLREDVCLPAALIRQQALEENIRWMQRYADARGVSLAPQGKTTMTPAIFRQQQAAGAWAIGVGNVWQAQAAITAGIRRVLMPNQLVGQANMRLAAGLKQAYPEVDFLCCVDELANARALSAFFAARQQKLDVLVELGLPNGRCGCRSAEEALALAQAVSELPGLRLRGLETYEGVLHGDGARAQVEALLSGAAKVACRMARYVEEEFILTGAGSVWYDVVCNVWLAAEMPPRCRIVLRPGCYITLDHGIYREAQSELLNRDRVAAAMSGGLQPALELAALVQSVPEKTLAVVNFGKRDAAFDAGLPQPIAHYRAGRPLSLRSNELHSVAIMDQHAILQKAPESDIQVGDLLIFGTSHPCLTFDKWRKLLLVDENYNVLEEWATAF
ncbi:amino acid deaminase [Erwinia sp. CGal63]|uniref:amino acid deaminase n=1 Tax=Erwinia sp. CGal63 TaxID=2919889 RepID=UPI003FA565B7